MRFGWISPQATSRCQLAVSHYGLCRVVTDSGTELPLSPYCNPLPAQLRQSRRFPRQLPTFLASFADMVSSVNSRGIPGRETAGGYLIHHGHSRQATLHTASLDRKGTLHRIAGLFRSRKESINPKVYRFSTATGLHGDRNYIPMPLGSILKP